MFINGVVYNNPLEAWLIATAIAVVVYIAFEILIRAILKRLVVLAGRVKNDAHDLVVNIFRKTKRFFLLILSLYIASQYLQLTPKVAVLVGNIMLIVFLLQVAIWGNAGISFWLERYISRKMKEDAAVVTMVSAFSYVARILLWVLLALIALDNLGVNVRTLIAGVGIGGIALALGVQNILKDIFASLSIATDKPFVYGDFISSGEFRGTVEHVGLKTTRLRSLTGEAIIISNSDLLQSRIRNYKRMFERRVAFTLGVVFNTPTEKLERIPQLLREIIERDQVRIDRIHFAKIGDFSLNFDIVYFVKSPDYNVFMDIQQDINLKILRRFEEEGIAFAYPTQSLYLEKPAADPSA